MFSSDPNTIDTCKLVGYCEKSGVLCLRYPFDNRAGGNLFVYGYCPDPGEQCVSFNLNSDGGNIQIVAEKGKDRMEKIFAKSYGIWEWQDASAGTLYSACESNKVCSLDGKDCSGSAACDSFKECQAVDEEYYCDGNHDYPCDPAKPNPCSNTCADINLCKDGINKGGTCTVPRDCPLNLVTQGGYTFSSSIPDIEIYKTLCTSGNTVCAHLPSVSNVKINNQQNGDLTIEGNGFINLTFNSDVDNNQEPMVAYKVDWGDGETTSVAGVEMRDHPTASGNPHSLYHLYDYWSLRRKGNCKETDGSCKIRPTVWIKDNWGWYSAGSEWNKPPDKPTPFGGTIVVTP